MVRLPRLPLDPALPVLALLAVCLLAPGSAASPAPPGADSAAGPAAFPASHSPGISTHSIPTPFAADAAIAAAAEPIRRMPGGVRDKADAILDLIFDEDDGLGFQYSSYPTRTAAGAFEARDGNCLSLVNLYLALARSAGLDAFPMEVEGFYSFSRRSGTLVRSTHVIGGLSVNGMLLTVDFLPDKPKAYRRIEPISDQRHAALVHNARAAEAMLEGRTGVAEVLYREALRLDPGNAEVWNNFGVLAKRDGDLDTARQRYHRALESDPQFLPALNNLTLLERHLGNREVADELAARALEEKYQSPYFLAQQAMHRARAGELDEARRLLLRARRIDREIPEVHLALGRVELARGHAHQAEEHFAAARRHSAPLPDRYRNKLDAKIGKLTKLAAAR